MGYEPRGRFPVTDGISHHVDTVLSLKGFGPSVAELLVDVDCVGVITGRHQVRRDPDTRTVICRGPTG